MPTISVKIIANPRKIRFCEGYQHYVLMFKSHVRIFGSAFCGDKPYVMYICMECARLSDDKKIIAALEKWSKSNER